MKEQYNEMLGALASAVDNLDSIRLSSEIIGSDAKIGGGVAKATIDALNVGELLVNINSFFKTLGFKETPIDNENDWRAGIFEAFKKLTEERVSILDELSKQSMMFKVNSLGQPVSLKQLITSQIESVTDSANLLS